MVTWLKNTIGKLFGLKPAPKPEPVCTCPTCGQVMPEQDKAEEFDFANWQPEEAPPEKLERADEKMDHVFDAKTYYHVASKPAGAFDAYPEGEGSAKSFVIVRSSRKLPDQYDENGRCRQLALEKLEELSEKCFAGLEEETPLDNVFDADKLSDEEFAGLWLQGSEGDLAYWSKTAAEEAVAEPGVASPRVAKPETLVP